MSAADHSWPAVLDLLLRRQALPRSATRWAMAEIMAGEASPAQIAAFAVLLHAKRETPEELSGLVEAMLDRSTPVPVVGAAVDVVGTGGDRAQTVNISTMAALVVAGTGRAVVKHGNRAASSRAGTADVLEELGVRIDHDADGVARSVAEVGIGFCFAPVFHPGMRHAAVPRREIGIPTAFNLLGPLTNPARPAAAAIGCFDLAMAPIMADVLGARGDCGFVVRGDDGLDEITTTTTSQMWVVAGGRSRHAVIDPARFGIEAAAPSALRGADAGYNAGVVREVLTGGAPTVANAVMLNAAAGVVAYDLATGSVRLDLTSQNPAAQQQVEQLLAGAVAQARSAIESGAADRLLQRWVAAS